MLTPDLYSRTYTAEVLRTRGKTDLVVKAIGELTIEHRPKEQVDGLGNTPIKILHSFVTSAIAYHRSTKIIEDKKLGTITLPRTKTIRKKQHFLYDVLVAQHGRDVIIAVPYHRLAENFFLKVDRALAGKKVVYEKLDITNLVIRLGQKGTAEVSSAGVPCKLEIGLTRCHLAYSDPHGRSRFVQQVSMSGSNLGASDIYRYLIMPVLDPEGYPHTVTPILMGFSLLADGVKKTGAITDRHGNFKLSVGPRARRVERLFSLLESIESIEGVVSRTGNLPILQSNVIRGTGED